MSGTRGARSGANESAQEDKQLEQIEYLLYQSTQGIHFMFDNSEIAKVLSQPADQDEFYSFENMERVQGLLSDLLDRPTMGEKRSFLERLSRPDYELLVRAYFQLVENTILAHSNIRH